MTAQVTESPRRTEFAAPTTMATSVPQMPTGAGEPLATSTRQEVPRRTDDTIWSASTTRPVQQAPIASSAPPLTLVESQSKSSTPVVPNAPDTNWGPSRVPVITEPSRMPSTPPQVTMSRGQAPADDALDETKLIRSTSFGRAEKVLVTSTGKKSLHVSMTVSYESDARDLAAIVSRLPELKEFAITFEAHLVK